MATTGGMTVEQARANAEGASELDAAYLRYLNNTASTEDLMLLQSVDPPYITSAQAYAYMEGQRETQAKADAAAEESANQPNPTAGLVPFDPATGEIGYPSESPIGRTSVEAGHVINTYADPSTGILYDRTGKALPQYLQTFVSGGGGGGGGSYASSEAYLAAREAEDKRQFDTQAAMSFQQLLNQQKQQEIDNQMNAAQQALNQQQFGETQRSNDASIQGNRVSAGANFMDFNRAYANDLRAAESDPFRYGEYLTNLARQAPGAGNPLQGLIGEGVEIKPQLPDPYTDPRWKKLVDSQYDYGTPPPMSDIARTRDAFTADPEAAQRFFSQDPEALKRMFGQTYAKGGDQVLHEPTMGIGMLSGEPKFLAGEAGPERLTFAPMHEHDADGMKVPHEHDGPPDEHEHENGITKYAKGGSVRFSNIGGAGGNIMGAVKKNRDASAANAAREQRHANALRTGTRIARSDGSFTIDGTAYSANSDADLYARGARQSRFNADPLGWSSGGSKFGLHGGSLLTDADREFYLARHPGWTDANVRADTAASPSTTGSLTGNAPVFGEAQTMRSSTTANSLGGPTALEASAGAGLSPLNKSTITPAQASAVSLGKALRPMGFVPPEVLAYLDAGMAPPPALVDGRMLSKLPPSLQQLLLGVVRQLGNKTEDWTAAQGQWNTPGFRGYVTL